MNAQRIVFALITSMQIGCAMAVTQNTVPKWTAFLMIAGTVLQAFMHSVWPSPPPAIEAAKAPPAP